jgi:Fe-S cluster assembly scaffold protein SufB
LAQSIATLDEEYVERLSTSFNEPKWMTDFRLRSLRSYLTLPEEQSNLYTKYALNLNVNLKSIQPKLLAKPDPKSAKLSEIAAGMESGHYYISTQSETIASKNIADLAPKGVIFCDLHEAVEKHGEILKKIFERKASSASVDKFAALNTALFDSAWLVYLPRDISLENPLRVRFYLNSIKPYFSQTWIYSDRGSKGSLLTESYGAELSGTASEVVEVYLEDGASFQYSNVQNYSDDTVVLANKRAVCEKDAHISWVLGYFGGRAERSRLDSIFSGQGSSAEDIEVVFGTGYQRYDIVSDLSHVGPFSKGRILCNSVLKENSRSIFKGMIRIGKDAKGSNAYLAGHGILLSPNAKSDAIPGLEILTNEVKATHSASVAQIDQDQIFYMMTRGVEEEEAKKFIVLGFLEPGISRIQSEELRDTIHALIEAKWYGKKGLITRQAKEVIFDEELPSSQQQRDIFEGHYKYR